MPYCILLSGENGHGSIAQNEPLLFVRESVRKEEVSRKLIAGKNRLRSYGALV